MMRLSSYIVVHYDKYILKTVPKETFIMVLSEGCATKMWIVIQIEHSLQNINFSFYLKNHTNFHISMLDISEKRPVSRIISF
jgi:hypothetical protein